MVTQKLTAPSETITGDIALLIVMKCCDGWLYIVGLFTGKTNVNYLDLSTRTLPPRLCFFNIIGLIMSCLVAILGFLPKADSHKE